MKINTCCLKDPFVDQMQKRVRSALEQLNKQGDWHIRKIQETIPREFIQKEYIVHVVKERIIYRNEVTLFYDSGDRHFAFTEVVENSSFIKVEKNTVNICSNYEITSCKVYNRTEITEYERLKPQQMTFGVEVEDIFREKTFVKEYIKLLHESLYITFKKTPWLEKSEIAIIGGPIRKSYMSYSSSIIDTSTTFTISAAKPLSKAVSLIKPFDKMVWIFISFSFVILLSTLYIVIKKETEYCNNGKLEFSTLFWILLRNFLRQDARINRCFYNTFRILIGCWILIAFVLTSAYVGILPSYIVNPGTESIPQTFEELTQSVIDGRYNITFYVLSDECRYFDRCPFKKFIPTTIIRNDVIEIFYENVIKYDETCTEQVEKVVKGTYALLASKHNIELSISKSGKEKFFVSKDALFTKFSFIQMNLARVNYAVEIAKT
ncbi:uncharacterized protein, partial [Centruroides vittatus]|uniref:uncharacterized protein n=1 Tax=Centruroides vittatus TaxID=120091 RepID=UPI00350EE18E